MSTALNNNSARDRVLETAELLEMILLRLHPIDARVATRVSRIFKAGFEASKKVQSQYMYKQNNTTVEPSINSALFETTKWSGTYRTVIDTLPYIFIATQDIDAKAMKVTACDRPYKSSHEMGDLARMYLTSSPVHVTLILAFSGALQSGDWDRAEVTLRNPRMGEVLDSILRLSYVADKTAQTWFGLKPVGVLPWERVFGKQLAALVVGEPTVDGEAVVGRYSWA